MRVRGAIAAGLAGAALAAGFADARSEIGGPPTLDLKRCDRFGPCSDPIVLGKAKHALGRVEMVGFQSRIGLCIEIDILRLGGGGTCPAAPVPVDGSAISIERFALSLARPFRYTAASGSLRPDVARVRVAYRRNGELKRRRAGVAQVDGDVLEAVQEEEPFGVVEALLQGCVGNKPLRFTAFAEDGTVLETERARARPAGCRRLKRHGVIRADASSRGNPVTYWREAE
jgi:hypothetical protein